MKKVWKRYLAWILALEAVGALSGLLVSDGIATYAQTVNPPPFTPPSWLFPVVWTVLYGLMGFGAARISLAEPSPQRTNALRWFFLQLFFVLLWPYLFFSLQWFGVALLWLAVLWCLIFGTIVTFSKVDSPAAWLQLPYLVWVTFAGYLNLGVWLYNR